MLLQLGHCDQWAELFEPDAVLRCACLENQVIAQRGFRGREELRCVGQGVVYGDFDSALGRVASIPRRRRLLYNICLFDHGFHHATGYAHVLVVSVSSAAPR
jgi:hypothetical protein